ncbi:hypothetical protein [Streptosporangium lutulentum]|uniref:Uncharacterized protein n=1 Tax=Streptosporangium lutulentum TaxID=1461250 RepID=A0ABT9QMU0_9ACTN|nr:hypothetical protein [Streptosporangium lutulentum]MDP9848068.1 hypothetical protein [Streptosporangium lutulentum]
MLGVATPETGGAKAHRGADADACFEAGELSGESKVRLRQGARLQQVTAVSTWQKSAEDRFTGGMGTTAWVDGAETVYVMGTRAVSACSSRTVGSKVTAGRDAGCRGVAVGSVTGAVLVSGGFEVAGLGSGGLTVAVRLGAGLGVSSGGAEVGSGRSGGSDASGVELGEDGAVSGASGAAVGPVLSAGAVGLGSSDGSLDGRSDGPSASSDGSEVSLTLTGGLTRDPFGASRSLEFLDGAVVGAARLGGAAALSGGGAVVLSGEGAGALSGGGAVVLSGGGAVVLSGGGAVVLSGGGAVVLSGGGAVVLSGGGAAVLSGGGTTALSGGGLRTGGGESSPRSGAGPAGGTHWPPSVSGRVSTGGGSALCDIGGTAVTPGSAMAAHGWAMIALVVAETAASRSPETRVTRRDELRGGIDGSSWICLYWVGAGPERGFQPAAVNSGVPGRATCGTVADRGSGMLTQSPRFAPRMSGFQLMSRLMAYGLE